MIKTFQHLLDSIGSKTPVDSEARVQVMGPDGLPYDITEVVVEHHDEADGSTTVWLKTEPY